MRLGVQVKTFPVWSLGPASAVLLVAAQVLSVSGQTPPGNDDFANAYVLTGNVVYFVGSNMGATSEPGEPVQDPGAAASIWWRWTAQETGDANFNTANSLGMTVLSAIYVGTSISNLTAIVPPTVTSSRSQSGSGSWTSLPFRAWGGETYHLRFSGVNGANGTIDGALGLTPNPNIPGNDNFAYRFHLSGYAHTIMANNAYASTEPGEFRAPRCDPSGRTLWWSYTAPSKGKLKVWAHGQTNVAIGALLRGETLTNLAMIGYGCDAALWLTVSNGETLQIQVDCAYGRSGPFTLETTLYTAPTNDLFVNAARLSGSDIAISGATLAASVETNEPGAAEGTAAYTVWYAWTAPWRSLVSLAAQSESMWPSIRVFTGPSVDHLQPVALQNNGFLGDADKIYYVQIDGPEAFFTFQLHAEQLARATNDNFADARVVESSGWGPAALVDYATFEPGEPKHLGGQPCKSLWWRWEAPVNGLGAVHSGGSMGPLVTVAVYRGTTLEALTLVTNGTASSLRFPVFGGESYYVAAACPSNDIGIVAISSGLVFSSQSRTIPGNLLREPSFENTELNLAYWRAVNIGGTINGPGGADGTTWVRLAPGSELWQDVPTVPGRLYEIRFAYNANGGGVHVQWGDQSAGVATSPPGPWHWARYTNVADAEGSRLMLTNTMPYTSVVPRTNSSGTVQWVTITNTGPTIWLDGFSVVWLSAPPEIISQPQSASAFPGHPIALTVGVTGTEPLSYQWYFDNEAIPGKTSRILNIDAVSRTSAGEYFVIITNAFGAVTSAPAPLNIEQDTSPRFVLQPSGDSVAVGEYFVMYVAAIGTPPLSYYWYRNGQPVSDATNRHLIFSAVQGEDAGVYKVQVTNYAGAAWSLPASLVIDENANGGGRVRFGNRFPVAGVLIDRPIFDVDSITKLNGPAYLAQLYAGPSVESLRATGTPSPFSGGFDEGIFQTKVVSIARVPAGSVAYAQVRAWDSRTGMTYEEARSFGGRFGRSEIFQVTPASALEVPPNLNGLGSFSLRNGLPYFATGRLSIAERRPDGSIVYSLEGEPGFRYLIERSSDDFHWEPLLILTNDTGQTSFIQTVSPGGPSVFYRSRIVD